MFLIPHHFDVDSIALIPLALHVIPLFANIFHFNPDAQSKDAYK